MEAERAYDFTGTHLPIHLSIGPSISDQPMEGGERARVVPFPPGLALAQPLLVAWPLSGEEHVANIEVGIADGQPACVAIHSAHGQPLTGTFVRSLPLSQIVTKAAERNTYRVFRTRRGRYIGVYYTDAFAGKLGFGEGLEELRNDLRRKRRTLNDEFLSEIAAVYRDARARRIPTTKAVQEHFGPTTPENARRWIALAREAGRLGAAVGQGRAGEQMTTKGAKDG